jgi:hypothetical protein
MKRRYLLLCIICVMALFIFRAAETTPFRGWRKPPNPTFPSVSQCSSVRKFQASHRSKCTPPLAPVATRLRG